MVICLEWGADLHTAQLMPLPLTVSCFSKVQIGFTFLVPAHPDSPGKRAIRLVVCVTVLFISYCVPVFFITDYFYWFYSRLYHSSTLPRRPSIILCSVHVSSLICAAGRLYGSSGSSVIYLYDFMATVALVICLVNSMVYEDCSSMDNRSVCTYLLMAAVALWLARLTEVWEDTGFSHTMDVVFIATAAAI